MEVLIPLPSPPMDFNSLGSTPLSSPPSSPKLLGEVYFSAPTSPSRTFELYRNISLVQRTPDSTVTDAYYDDEDDHDHDLLKKDDGGDHDFAFDFSGQLEKPSLTAEELFDQGKIRPMETLKKSSVFSPKTKQEKKNKANPITDISKQEQGRERVSVISSKSIHRSTKSLSEFVFDEEEEQSRESVTSITKSSYYYFFTKWKLKDLILFRSASEGRAAEKDPLKKFTALNKRQQEVKNSSFRSIDGSSSSSGSMRRGPVSALELHYKPKKSVRDELKRRTYLPYTQGLLGCVGFNPTVSGLAKGLNSITRR